RGHPASARSRAAEIRVPDLRRAPCLASGWRPLAVNATETDLLILGGGPAGTAAALTAGAEGLRVVVLERESSPRLRLGEAVHPGIEALLRRLGVLDAVLAAGFLRHAGHWVQWGDAARRFVPFGSDRSESWRGFQLWRPTFDAIMLD